MTQTGLTGKKRLYWVLIIFAALLLALVVRLFYIQVIQGPKLQEMALSQWTKDTALSAARGRIMDRSGTVLAQSGTAYKVLLWPNLIDATERERVAAELSQVLGMSKGYVLTKVSDVTKQEIVLNVPNTLTGYDPRTGEKLWYCEGIPDGYLCPSVIGEGDVAYAIGARKNSAMAVRTGGRGDVTESHVLWRTNKGSNVSSPVYVDGHLYWFHESRGTAICVDAKTGEVVFEERLEPRAGLIYASVLAADGKLYALSQNRGTYVLAARPEFQQLAVNVFADDNSRANASPVVSDGQILLRTDKALYCLGK